MKEAVDINIEPINTVTRPIIKLRDRSRLTYGKLFTLVVEDFIYNNKDVSQLS